MGHWLAPRGAAMARAWAKKFDARCWTVDFPRPMMASAVTTAPDALRVECVFHGQADLAGLIWEAEDRHDHPLLAYETDRDFRGCVLRFRWRSGGLKPLDALHGPTLTIEGRDASGIARSWYVRLWNHAEGSGEDAWVTLDFDSLAGGWDGDDPVWAADIDRMFVSLVAPGYTGEAAPLAAAAEGWAELTGIACAGARSMLRIGETLVPEHRLRIATGYDDLYHLTPERVLRGCLALGYRGPINHYVGMSHYFALGGDGLVAAGLNAPCAAWHADFAGRAKALGYELIVSLSYELLDAHCPDAWKQRAADGTPALTGWSPPSALLSPASGAAMAWLQDIGRAFAALAAGAGLRVRFQVGEPWWWVMPDGRICLYDDAAAAAFSPVPIADVRGALDGAQKATLDAAGALLAASTAALCAAVREAAPDAETLLLAYLPTVLDGAETKRANLPAGWAAPAFDVLQLEDYEWVTTGDAGASRRGAAAVAQRLGYPPGARHYLAGFVAAAEDAGQWPRIAAAIDRSDAAQTFVWALPQVLRDGFTWFEEKEDGMDAFDDVLFPIALGREASVEPGFSTQVVTTANGFEQRNSDWAEARLRFDAGPGVRGEAELKTLIAFFRARRGAAAAFRFRDPFDHDAEQALLGSGDGVRTGFALVKHYGGHARRITRPVAESVRVFVDGAEATGGWALEAGGIVRFDTAPAPEATVRADFTFDVPVRFAEDRLHISRATFEAGEIASVPLIEVREAAA